MRIKFAILVVLTVALVTGSAQTTSPQTASPKKIADIDIPYGRFVLDNGLTVIIHEDHHDGYRGQRH